MKQLKNPHVVYVLTKLELGGAQKVCLALFEGMHQAHINTSLITGTEGVLTPLVKDKREVTLLPSLVRHISVIQDFYCLKELITQLALYKKKYPELIVHTHSTKAGILGRCAAWWLSLKVVHTIHGYGFHDNQSKLVWLSIYCIELLLSVCTTHYLCVSRADAKTGIRLFPGFKNRHTIIHAAVDHTHFIRSIDQALHFPSESEPFIFGTISCFKPQKNLQDLIKAFASVHAIKPQVRLEIVGDGVLRHELEMLIKKYNLTKHVTLHGWKHDVYPYMKQWHSFILSSLWEGLPCAIVEARLMHIPVACYDTGGIGEVIFHDTNGLLAPRGNWTMLAHHMQALASSEQLYTRLQRHRDDLSDFDIPSMIQNHRTVYHSLIRNNMQSLADEL
jgi:glycosyltransferase involved in cell wall biosynthesis